jgi:hypothetical protein
MERQGKRKKLTEGTLPGYKVEWLQEQLDAIETNLAPFKSRLARGEELHPAERALVRSHIVNAFRYLKESGLDPAHFTVGAEGILTRGAFETRWEQRGEAKVLKFTVYEETPGEAPRNLRRLPPPPERLLGPR